MESQQIPRTQDDFGWTLTHIMAVNAGAGLLVERKRRPLLLLENNTELPFITGDQPVVNLLPASVPGAPPVLLAFYYPVSPTLAIILDEIDERTGYRSGLLKVDAVQNLNARIVKASHRQLFANSRRALEHAIDGPIIRG